VLGKRRGVNFFTFYILMYNVTNVKSFDNRYKRVIKPNRFKKSRTRKQEFLDMFIANVFNLKGVCMVIFYLFCDKKISPIKMVLLK